MFEKLQETHKFELPENLIETEFNGLKEKSSIESNDRDNNRWEQINKGKNNSLYYDEISNLEDRIAEPKKSLRNYLLEQILLEIPKGEERKVAILFLDIIEPTGWININLSDFSHINNIKIDVAINVL